MYNPLTFASPYAPGQEFSLDPSTMGNYGMDWGKGTTLAPTFMAPTKSGPTSPWSMEGAFGQFGWAPHAINAASGLMQGFIGMKQYGLGKKQLAENKRQFNLNYGAQQKLTNSQLRDRQRARVASNPGVYESVDSYMAENGI